MNIFLNNKIFLSSKDDILVRMYYGGIKSDSLWFLNIKSNINQPLFKGALLIIDSELLLAIKTINYAK